MAVCRLFRASGALVPSRLCCALVLALLVGSVGRVSAQGPAGVGGDPFGLTRLKPWGAYRSSSNNPDPDSNDDSKRPIPGETTVLADLRGPGVVTHIWVTVADSEYGWPRLLRLRVYYDGSPTPSVDAPLGDFFAVGHGLERGVASLMIRDSSSGRSRNSYWPMPFRQSCRITVTNEGRRRVSNLYYHVDWAKLPALPPDTVYFHARYRQALPATAGRRYEILSVKGRGHYVGTVLSVIQAEPGWFGEGDDRFYVDGERAARIEGTGTEDYFNDAWSLRVADGPYTGVPVADGEGVGARMTAYRWHLVDPVPFTRSLVFNIEHVGWTYNADGSVRSAAEERPDLFSSVAFWYQDGIATDQPDLPYGPGRLPHGQARQIEVEDSIADVTTEGGTASVQREVFWGKDLLFFEARGPGSKIHVPLDVPAAGRYEVTAQVAHAPDYGTYEVLLDGKPVDEAGQREHEPGATTATATRFDAYFSEVYVAEDHLLGWLTLSAGRHVVTFACTGKRPESSNYHLGIDTFILAKVGPVVESEVSRRSRALRVVGERRHADAEELTTLAEALRDRADEVREASAWSLGQLTAAASPLVPALTVALGDRDPVVRGLSALALRDAGPSALSALDALIAHLRDDDVNVRMMVAQAIGSRGAHAARAVEPLIDACHRPDEHVHVQRSLADALGAIGPAARPALPVLRELAKIPRVRWSADAAIRSIGG
jgi:hypothetical protein